MATGDSTGKTTDSTDKPERKVTEPVTPHTPRTHKSEHIFGEGTLRDAIAVKSEASQKNRKGNDIPDPWGDPFADAEDAAKKKSAAKKRDDGTVGGTLVPLAILGAVAVSGDGDKDGNDGDEKKEKEGDKKEDNKQVERPQSTNKGRPDLLELLGASSKDPKTTVHVEANDGGILRQNPDQPTRIFTDGLDGCIGLAIDVRLPKDGDKPAERVLILTHYRHSDSADNAAKLRTLIGKIARPGVKAEALMLVDSEAESMLGINTDKLADEFQSRLRTLLGSDSVKVRKEEYPLQDRHNYRTENTVFALTMPPGDGPVTYYAWYGDEHRQLGNGKPAEPRDGGGDGKDVHDRKDDKSSDATDAKAAKEQALARFARDYPELASPKFQNQLNQELKDVTRDWQSFSSDLELCKRLMKMAAQSRQAQENMQMAGVPEWADAARENAERYDKLNEPLHKKLSEELQRRAESIEKAFNKVLKDNGQSPVKIVPAIHNRGDRPEIRQGGAQIVGTNVIEVDVDLLLSGRPPDVIAEGLTHEYVHFRQNQDITLDCIDDVESGHSKYGKGEAAVRLEYRERTGVDSKISEGEKFDLTRKSMEARVFNSLPEATRARILGSTDLLPADSLISADKLVGKHLTADEFNNLKPDERKLLTGRRLWPDLQEDCQKTYKDMKDRAGDKPVLSREFKTRASELAKATGEYGVNDARAGALAQRIDSLRHARDLLNMEGGVEVLLKRLTMPDDKVDRLGHRAMGSKLKEHLFGDKKIPDELSTLIDDFTAARTKDGGVDHKKWTEEKSTRANKLLRKPINEGLETAPPQLNKEMDKYYGNRLEQDAYASAEFRPPDKGVLVDFKWGKDTKRGQVVHTFDDGSVLLIDPEGQPGGMREKTAQDKELKDIKLPPSIDRFIKMMNGTGKVFTDGKGNCLLEFPGGDLVEFSPLKVVSRDKVSRAQSDFKSGQQIYDERVRDGKLNNPLLHAVETGDFSDFRRIGERRVDLAMDTSWAVPHRESLGSIYNFAGQQGIVEIGAGKGYWAHMLRQMGVDVAAYDLKPLEAGANDFHSGKSWSKVDKGDASMAGRHPDRALMLCCPPPEDPMAADALKAYSDAGGKKLIFVGKIPVDGIDEPVIFGDKAFHDALKKDWLLKESVDLPGMPHETGLSSEKLYIFERRTDGKGARPSLPRPDDDKPKPDDKPDARPKEEKSVFNEAERKALDEAKKVLDREAPGLDISAQNDTALKAMLAEVAKQLGEGDRKQINDLLKDFKGDDVRRHLAPESVKTAKSAQATRTVGLASGEEGRVNRLDAIEQSVGRVTAFDEARALEIRRSGKILETLKADGMDEKRARDLEEKLTSKDPNERARALVEVDEYYDRLIAASEAEATRPEAREGGREGTGEKGRFGRGWERFARKFGENKGRIGTLVVVVGPLVPLMLSRQAEGEGWFGGATFSK